MIEGPGREWFYPSVSVKELSARLRVSLLCREAQSRDGAAPPKQGCAQGCGLTPRSPRAPVPPCSQGGTLLSPEPSVLEKGLSQAKQLTPGGAFCGRALVLFI